MTLQNKKSIFNGYNISVILLVPVITFLTIGFDTGLFPKFWDTVYGGNISEENPYYFVFMRENFSFSYTYLYLVFAVNELKEIR